MRIGIFSQCYLPTNNGVVASVETFRKELEKHGHQYFIFAPETPGYEEITTAAGGPEYVFRFPAFTWPGQKNYPIAWPINRREVIHLIKNLKLDIIHAQHLFTIGRLGQVVAKELNIPFVFTYHTLIEEYTHYVPLVGSLAKKYIIKMSRDFCNDSEKIITPSPSMKKILEGYGVTKPILAIPTGVNIEALQHPFRRDDIRQMWGIPENKHILLYVSRMAKEKNVGFLLEAFRQLVRLREHRLGRIDIHLLMVGGGPELDSFKKKVTGWGLESAVTFTDMVKPELAKRYFGVADVFVFPSVTETQGIVVTEAQAAGVPVVAVNRMGPSDLIKNGEDGYLTDLNVGEFVAKINKLLDDSGLRHQMSKSARKNAEQYSSLNCALQMENLYEHTRNCYCP